MPPPETSLVTPDAADNTEQALALQEAITMLALEEAGLFGTIPIAAGGGNQSTQLATWLNWIGIHNYTVRAGKYGELLGTDFMYV